MKGQRSHLNDPKHEREHELDVADIRNPETRHEVGYINVRSVYTFLVWLGLFVIVSYLIVYGIMKLNDSRIERENAVVTHVAKTKSEELPPEPRLQLAPGHAEHPIDEGIYYRDSVIRVLESYGYINKATGSVHIPIDLAKDLVLKKGFPTRAQAATDEGRIDVPGFESSGRMLERRDQRIPGGTFTVTGGNLNVDTTLENE